MYRRVLESVIAAWLIASSILLALPDAMETRLLPLAVGVFILFVVALARRGSRMHALVPVMAVLFTVWGWTRFARPGPAVAQNAILMGLLLTLLGFVPDEATRPPPGWRPWVREEPNSGREGRTE